MGLFKRTKNTNKPVLRQILDLIPDWILHRNISKFNSDKGCHKYKTYDQLVALTFGQLCKCTTLADISAGLSVSQTFIADLKLKQNPAKSTMSDGNKNRTWRVFESLYFIILPESWTRGLVKKSLNLTKRYDQTNPPQIFA